MKYCKPTFEPIATFKKDTKGLWTGNFVMSLVDVQS